MKTVAKTRGGVNTMPIHTSLWTIPDAVLERCETPLGADRRADEMISRLPVVPHFARWRSGARRVLASSLHAAARHPDPRLRGNASMLMIWLSGSGRNLGGAVQALRRTGTGDARRAATALEGTLRESGAELGAICSLARSAVLMSAMLAADEEVPLGPDADSVDSIEGHDDGRGS